MGKLSDRDQAILMLLVFVLPPIITWASLGMPTDRVALGILISAILSGVLAFIKEILGGKPPQEEDPPEEDERSSSFKLPERVAILETDVKWIKETVQKIEGRTWWILGSVVALGLIAILIALFG